MEPLRIVQVVPQLVVGGAERFATWLAEAQLAMGHDVHLLVIRAGDQPLAERLPASLKHRTWYVARASRWDARAMPRAMRALRRLRPDVVHTHLFTGLAWGTTAARLAGVPAVVHTQHAVHDDEHAWLPAVRRVLARGLDAVVACSDAVQIDLARRGLAPGVPVITIPNGIPLDHRPRSRLDGDPLHVGAVGRAVPIKGHAHLIDAVARLRDRGVEVRCTICGDGESLADLRAQVERLDLGASVQLPGRVDDVAERLARFDVFAQPSLSEAMPIALIEAAAAGLPLLVTTSGGGDTLLRAGAGGEAVAAGDPAALADVLERWVHMDRDDLRALGARSRATALGRYGIRACAEAHDALYRSVLGR